MYGRALLILAAIQGVALIIKKASDRVHHLSYGLAACSYGVQIPNIKI